VGGVRNHNQTIKKLQAQKKVNPAIMAISISIFDWIFKYSAINPTLKPTSKEIIATLKMIPLFEAIHSLFLYQNAGFMIYSANAPSRGFYERCAASKIPADLACYMAIYTRLIYRFFLEKNRTAIKNKMHVP
jgi:hypothetical protein